MRNLVVLGFILSFILISVIRFPTQILASYQISRRIPPPTPVPITPKVISQIIPQFTPKPTPQVVSQTNSFIASINQYRASLGLRPVQTNPKTCSFAATRAAEINSSFSHDGFYKRVSSGTLPYPSYSAVVENLAVDANPQEVVSLWINSPTHATNLRQNTPYGCVAQVGNFFAYEGWTP